MFCVGSRITFSDGRGAAARNAEEFMKVIGIGTPTNIASYVDSISFNVDVKENGGITASFANKDTGEKYSFDTDEAIDVIPSVEKFLKTGERDTSLPWTAG